MPGQRRDAHGRFAPGRTAVPTIAPTAVHAAVPAPPAAHQDITAMYTGFASAVAVATSTRPEPGRDHPTFAEHVKVLAARIRDRDYPATMTTREILALYQGLDNDRLYSYPHGRNRGQAEEAEERFWKRKLREAVGNRRQSRWWRVYVHMDGLPKFSPVDFKPEIEGHANLMEAVAVDGVRDPISLRADLDRHGSHGKPEILGGHHRVAVSHHLDPDAAVPVAFFDTVADAQEGLGEQF